ncbi:GL16018 [Drosophila persimilis]|uniref:Mitochondrial inner membrane protein Mpv17 n=1 Tax=Drosophila persimilis TaxID=7234 RepID=B4H9Y0_DROPE|nr:mpv17-like protein [Drosophila persimilis]EDW36637.1 GL16018 [Drosophila persimilis]
MALRGYIREGLNVAAIMGAGDSIAQLFIEKKSLEQWDTGRTARFSALGLLFVGPILRKWYLTLETLVSKDQPSLTRGIKKMVIDQTVFAPTFTLAMSFMVPFVNGEDTEKIKTRIRNSYFSIMLKNYMLWPAAQFVNFTFVPLPYQVMYAQFIAIIWNCYISLILNK